MKNRHSHFPLFIDISKMNILVIGAGQIACRRIETLLLFDSHITVVSPEIREEVRQLPVELIEREFQASDLNHRDMVIIATNDEVLNERIANICTHKEILKNVISNRELCDFYFPGIIQEEEAVIGITTGGASPKKAKEIRKKIQKGLQTEHE
ncbi:MAG: bifunctional precorrin-2 dehydrogenase/sirohydrochlorin ferrochelatase [Lachnospiraceae bacterium]|nr:bifunctional precorrin-2 dehydrogenase/sirohydrochlorin ferrochelatase [Lachnospiraceae bacterium]MDD3617282.1 bifunctional precorrin-2 dehydrogenase/sirohydrochlorin ferrochelatase [Lachnospiraceae bacterium]